MELYATAYSRNLVGFKTLREIPELGRKLVSACFDTFVVVEPFQRIMAISIYSRKASRSSALPHVTKNGPLSKNVEGLEDVLSIS